MKIKRELTMRLSNNTIVQLILISAIIVGYFTIDFNKVLAFIQGEGEYIIQSSQCDLHKRPCDITIQDGTKYTLEVFPKDIPLMKKLTFKITSSNAKEENINLKIYATNMFMGEFVYHFTKQQDGSFISEGTLPTCPVGNMQWNADLEKETISKKIGARFQFKTDI